MSDNFLKKRVEDFKNVGRNYKKVRGSPFARLNIAYKARIIVVSLLIPYIAYLGYRMVVTMPNNGFTSTITRVVSIAILVFLCYKIYETIPISKKQIEYYKKYPHLINYAPENVKETVDSILNKFKEEKNENLANTKEITQPTTSTEGTSKGTKA